MTRRRGSASWLLLAAFVAACSVVPGLGGGQPTNDKAIPPIVPVAAGESGQGAFRAVVYRTSDGWTCLEIVGGPGGASCGQGEDALLGIGWSSDPNGGGMITGGTKVAGAAGVSVVLDDGSVVPGTIATVPPPIASPGVVVYVIPLPPGRSPVRANVVDRQGAVLESTEF